MPRVALRGVVLSPLFALLLLVAPRAGAEVYQWVDENGEVHYTIRRGESQRSPRKRLRAVAPETSVRAPRAVVRETESRASNPRPLTAPAVQPDAGSGADSGPRPSAPPRTRVPLSEIAELEAQIESYRAELKQILSAQREAGT